MAVQIKQRVTVQAFEQFILRPENMERSFEYVGGEIVEVVSNPYSSKIAAQISGFLFVHLQQNAIGHLTGADGGYVVSGERYIPNVAFISYARQPELSYTDGYNSNPPELAVEVLSPGNDDEKMRVKITNYLAAGTVVWLVNPGIREVEVYIPGQPVRMMGENDTLNGGEALPGLRLAVKDIFPKP